MTDPEADPPGSWDSRTGFSLFGSRTKKDSGDEARIGIAWLPVASRPDCFFDHESIISSLV